MKSTFLLLILVCFSCKTVKIDNQSNNTFLVGTYTNGDSKGIYKYSIDAEGKLAKIKLVAEAENPSFLARTSDNKTLLAVNEINDKGTGYVTSYQIREDTLVFKSKSKSGGGNPCFINVNNKNQVLVANYSGGNIGYLKVDDQNGLTNLLDVQQHFGKGTTNRQRAPHAHSVWFHPNNKDIISVDLGTNELWFSTIVDDNLAPKSNQQKLKMEAGAGPRHLTFHPNKEWIYVLNELNNTVSLVKQIDGNYETISSISTLPKDFKKYSKAADIHISKDGKFLYASNRGHESVVIFKVDAKTGNLTLVGFENVRGVHPRNFSLTPDNNFIIVANQDTNNLVSFRRNSKTGKLTFVNEIEAPKPVCVLF